MENQLSNDNDEKPKTCFERSRFAVIRSITVEPIIILFYLPSVMSMLATANLDLEKACRVNLNLNQTICDGLTTRNSSMYNETDEAQVQKLVAQMGAWKNVIKSIIPSILLLFCGAWCDRNQRVKPCMYLSIIGEILNCTGLFLCTYFFYELPMEVNGIVESIPTSLTGGWFTMLMAVVSYVSLVSTNETRTVRIGAVNIIQVVSCTLGITLSGLLFSYIGFYGVYSIVLSMYFIAIIYTITVKEVKSTKDMEESSTNRQGFVKDFFNIKHFLSTLKVAFKPRQKNWRKRICVIMVLVMVVIGPFHGELSVIYLFTRYRFGWSVLDFSIYYSYNLVMHMLGTIFSLLFFSKFLKLDDALLGMISSISKILSCFLYTFAPNSTIFYVAVIVEILNGTSFIAMRSIISKLVPADELGKINSLFGVCEALMPLVYGPMYSLIYKATIDFLPGAFFLVGGGLTIPAVFIFLWLYLEHKQDAKENARNGDQIGELMTR